MKKYEISQAALAAYWRRGKSSSMATWALISPCPETASIQWTPEALLHVVKAVLETGRMG